MNLEKLKGQVSIREMIRDCSEQDHVQQVAYSTYHDALTQICFDCQTVRTNIEDVKQKDGDSLED